MHSKFMCEFFFEYIHNLYKFDYNIIDNITNK